MSRERILPASTLIGALALVLCTSCPDDTPTPEPGGTQPAPGAGGPDSGAGGPDSDVGGPDSAQQPDPGDPPPPPPESEPQGTDWAELGTLWRKASSDPDSFNEEERILLEAIFVSVPPEVEGAQWQVTTVIDTRTAELKADLMRAGAQVASVDLKFRLDLDDTLRGDYGETEVGGYRATIRGRFAFLQAHDIEVRMSGISQDWKDTAKLTLLLERFPLDRFAEL